MSQPIGVRGFVAHVTDVEAIHFLEPGDRPQGARVEEPQVPSHEVPARAEDEQVVAEAERAVERAPVTSCCRSADDSWAATLVIR